MQEPRSQGKKVDVHGFAPRSSRDARGLKPSRILRCEILRGGIGAGRWVRATLNLRR
jgi:hypothetical protein